jgi:DNA-binding MarR family transcriptional regulator
VLPGGLGAAIFDENVWEARVSATASRAHRAAGKDEAAEEGAPDEKRGGVDYGPLDRRIGYLLRRAQIAVFKDFFAAFEVYDIRPGQYSILTVIERNPGMKQGEVSAALGIKRANFVAMIDVLETREFVRRDPTPGDRRSYALRLTEKGARLMTELHALSERHERKIADAIGIETYLSLSSPLKAIARLWDGDGQDE